jgi:hypothetical protein
VIEDYEPGIGNAAKRARRANFRETLFGDLRPDRSAHQHQDPDTETENTFLESRALKGQTRVRYEQTWEKFRAFAREANLSTKDRDLDDSCTEYMDEVFFTGAGVEEGQYLLAATLWKRPHLRRLQHGAGLPRVRRALRGWRSVHPPRSRAPLPRAAAALVAWKLVAAGRRRMALGVWLSLECYFRPGEMLSLEVRDLVPPVAGAAGGGQQWGIRLHPWERGAPSKTGEFDSVLMLDLQRHQDLFPLLSELKRTAQPEEKLVPEDYQTVVREVAKAVVAANVQVLRPVLYSLRHAGASGDAADSVRTVAGIKGRGRWSSDRSVQRYKKSGLINSELMKLDAQTRARGLAAANRIGAVLGGTFRGA